MGDFEASNGGAQVFGIGQGFQTILSLKSINLGVGLAKLGLQELSSRVGYFTGGIFW
jgi:hypothetical protein